MPHPELFADPNVVMFGKLLLAVVLGGVIGTERALLAKQYAGTRTFGLVAVGATLFGIVGHFDHLGVLGAGDIQRRVSAGGVVAGIGFLGGGLIVFKGDSLHGVTTAAGLWMTAGIGMAVGFGLYALATFATLMVLILFTGMWYVENRFKHWFEQNMRDSHTGQSLL